MIIHLFGASGFLGYHIAKQATQRFADARIVIVHRYSSDLSEIKKIDFNFDYFETDFSLDSLHLIKESDVIINTIGDTDISPLNHARMYEINVNLAIRIAELALHLKAKLIHTSSISAYGFHDKKIDENTESSAMKSGIKYHETKYLSDKKIKEMAKYDGLHAVIMNPAAIIGTHDKHNWSQLVQMIKTNTLPGIPPGIGSYCHVVEVAKAHLAAIERGKVGENYLLGGPDHSFKEVVDVICEELNLENTFKVAPVWLLRTLGFFNDIKTKITGKGQSLSYEKSLLITKRTCIDSSKAARELGYDNTVAMPLMFKECVQWLESN